MHPPPAEAGTMSPSDSMAATCAAATAEPGRTGRPKAIDAELQDAHRAEDLLERDRAEMAKPEDLAGELPCPPASTRPRRLSSLLKPFQSRSSGTSAPVTSATRARSAKAGSRARSDRPGSRRARHVPGEDCSAPSSFISRMPSST